MAETVRDEVGVTLVASLAAAERELAIRRAKAAEASGASAAPWWSDAQRCVAMLCRHADEGARVVVEALQSTPAAQWRALLPSLDAQPTEAVRALRATWAAQLRAHGRGEPVEIAPIPNSVVRAEAPRAPEAQGEFPTALMALAKPEKRRALDEEKVAARLRRIAARWFSTTPREVEEAPDEPPEAARGSWYEVAPNADDALALYVVVARGERLKSFVKVLTVRVGTRTHAVRRENLLRIGARIAVTPSSDALTWTTGDAEHDADFAEELALLGLNGLPLDRVTVFRLDPRGPGQQCAGNTVSPGSSYALLAPPSVTLPTALGAPTPCGDGWRLLSLTLPEDVSPALVAALREISLGIGRAPLSLAWIGPSPTRYDERLTGESFACLRPNDLAVVRVESAAVTGEACVFVHGPDGLSRHDLSRSDRWTLALDALSPGEYLIEATSPDASVEPARLLFRVDPEASGRWRLPMPTVRVGEQPLAPGAWPFLDLTQCSLALDAVPGTPVSLRWTGLSRWRSPELHANADSAVPLEGAIARLGPHLARSPIGTLVLDLGVWGVAVVQHRRRPDLAAGGAVRRSLLGLVEDGLALRAQAENNPTLFRDLWVEPLAQALGWGIRPATTSDPPGLFLLLRAARNGPMGVVANPHALLAVMQSPLDRSVWAESALQRELQSRCTAEGVTEAIVTDVERWWRVDPSSTRFRSGLALRDALDDEERFEDFLAEFSSWGHLR